MVLGVVSHQEVVHRLVVLDPESSSVFRQLLVSHAEPHLFDVRTLLGLYHTLLGVLYMK